MSNQQLTPPANASVIVNPKSVLYQNYLDLNHDVLPWLNIPADGSFTRTVQLQTATNYVCQMSQKLLGFPIAPTSYFGRFDGASGWNGAYILLPAYPILGVQKVAEWWGTSGPNYLSESTPEYQTDGFNIDADTGMLTRVFPGNVQRPWFPGARSIEITWTAGYNPVPDEFRLPALDIIAEYWQETQQESASVPLPGGLGGILTEPGSAYPGLPRRVMAVFQSSGHIGIA